MKLPQYSCLVAYRNNWIKPVDALNWQMCFQPHASPDKLTSLLPIAGFGIFLPRNIGMNPSRVKLLKYDLASVMQLSFDFLILKKQQY